jgi:hypothetical protein
VKSGTGIEKISAYPNPVNGNDINLLLENIATGTYMLRVINVNGAVVAAKEIKHTAVSQTHTINIPDLLPGNYYLELARSDSKLLLYKIIKL